MATQITVNGRVLLAQSNLPLEGIKIELWDSVNVYGLIGSVFSNVDGAFSFIINDPSASLIDTGTIIPVYKTSKDCIALANTSSTTGGILTISISENVYDSAITDCMPVDEASYLLIRGQVIDKKGMVVNNVNVCVYEKGFRSEVLVAQTTTNLSGSYEAKVKTRLLSNSKVLTDRSIVVKALNGETVIATSIDLKWDKDVDIIANLITNDSYTASSHFENLLAKINYILDAVTFSDFATAVDFSSSDGNSNGELSYIANAIGKDISDVQLIVRSYQFSVESTVDHQLMHAVARANGIGRNPLLNLNDVLIRAAISRSINDNLIPPHTTESIDAFVAAAKVYQVTSAKNILISGETHTLGTVLNNIFGGSTPDTDTTDFLTRYNSQEFEDVNDFWAAYSALSAASAIKAEKAQRGLRLASITGFQPEMISGLMGDTSSGIHHVAGWSENTWKNYIGTISTAAGKLCVPASIKGTLTDDDVIKTLYAKKLRSVVQDLYPLTAMNENLNDGTIGPTLIADSATRTQVVTFITNNPQFDLRTSSIYDINADNLTLDLTGITNFGDVQQAMGSFQRVFRIIGGNPDAAATMIAAGHDSASAISAMPLSSFVSTYSSLLGGSTAATAAYAKSTTVSSVAMSSFVGSYALGSVSMSTVLPGWGTTGLSTTGTHADPTLTTLFGNMNYCACEQCLSVYSPAAYLTDILNFLREGVTNPTLYPAIYKELMRRRPDIENIDMTCKNTNTVMPYIDLVIELMELLVLKNIVAPTSPAPSPAFSIPLSFQTNGTADELAAHPEHVYKVASTSGGIYSWQYLDYSYYEKVYDPLGSGPSAWSGKNLTTEVYPYNLPFSLPAEETRTYLNYLGASRYELMKNFKPFSATTAYPITDFDIYSELLGLSEAEAIIVANTHPLIATSPWLFYGLAGAAGTIIDPADTSLSITYTLWYSLLGERLDVLVQQLKITYKEFLQFFTTDFLNKPVSGVRPYTISSKDSAVPDTCDLTKLHIVSEDLPILFGKLHRFVRLWRTNLMSVQDWDTLLRALRITTLDDTDFKLIGRVIEFTRRTGLKVTEIAGWWGFIDIHQYVDYGTDSPDKQPSVYDLLYRNRAVINLPLQEFADLGSFDAWTVPPGNLPVVYDDSTRHFVAPIAAANRIKESDLLLILDRMSVMSLASPVGLDQLSAIYSYSNLCKNTGYTVTELLEIMYLLDISVLDISSTPSTINARLDKLDDLLTTIDTLKNSSFSLLEVDYLVKNVGYAGPVAPSPVTIQTFYENLRNELQKFPLFTIPATWGSLTPEETDALHKLMNLLYQHFAKEFNIPSDWVRLIMVAPAGAPIPPLFIDLLSSDFLFNPTYATLPIIEYPTFIPDPVSGSATGIVPYLYQSYKYTYKVAYIASRLKLNDAEFPYLFQNPTTIGFTFVNLLPAYPATLPSDLTPFPLVETVFRGFLQLTRWVDIRNKLSLIEDQLVKLLSSTGTMVGLTLGDRFDLWRSIVNRDVWGTMMVDLIGDSSTVGTASGLLNAKFADDFMPNDLQSISRLWGIVKILATCVRTGLKPKTLQYVLFQDLKMSDAHQVLMAAKGKHTEKEWAKIAKPLRDTLRRKQRDALIGFVVAHPDTSVSTDLKKWRNENDLYAFLLIDVEMDACMQTSRIKQAICSVQLYIDRVMLGIECVNMDNSSRINLPADMAYQWEQWRKWYRIWEANRKVFLYPENWIEPELRDDKSIFFEEMEAILMQGDITKERAEDAMNDYLRKLEVVARLEPIAVCDTVDPVTSRIITHAFARTYTKPYQYFYRRLVDYHWTPWERIEIDITGEHTFAIVHNNKLYLFWLSFRERTIASTKDIISSSLAVTGADPTHHCVWFFNHSAQGNTEVAVNEPNPVYVTQIEVSLNWTEYKDSKWQEQKVAKEKTCINLNPKIHSLFPAIFDSSSPLAPIASVVNKYTFATNNKKLGLVDFIISRFKLSGYSLGELVIDISFPHDFYFTSGYGNEEDARPTKIYYFNGGDPVEHDYDMNNVVAPTGTIVSNNRFVQWQNPVTTSGVTTIREALNIDTVRVTPTLNTVYVYNWEGASILNLNERSSSVQILKKSPHGIYRLVNHQNTYRSPLEKGFFYSDDVNTFYARLVEPAAFPGSSSPVSLSTASDDASKWYQTTAQVWWNPSTTYGSDVYMTCAAFGVSKHYKFYFQNFAHNHVGDFIAALNSGGVDNFLKIQSQNNINTMNFGTGTNLYQPTAIVFNNYPTNIVDFDFGATYSVYNWELFFHTPLLIAKRLSDNQQFADARKWYHYIFDPTSNVDDAGTITPSKKRFWRFRPFYDLAGMTLTTLDDLLLQINAGNALALTQVRLWMDNPFKPHLIARIRILAYMKNVVMCYLDNLIAWGDKLYRQNTIESINEATQLYIMAANILGPRPQEVPKRAETGPRTFKELAALGLDAFSNALVAIEHYIDPNSGPLMIGGGGTGTPPQPAKMFYYCLPNNPELLAYWDTVENRLFNIRHCRKIDGQIQQLPLFDAPIDPALLVRAAAAGVDAGSVLDDLTTPPMPYRFSVMLQKSNELCNDVKALGNALLSALEKKDAEALALLRSGQEISMLNTMKAMKQAQIDEAAANIAALRSSKEVAQTRYNYYSTRAFISTRESKHLSLLDEAQTHQNRASTLMAVGTFLSILPEVNLQAPMSIGPSFGGRELNALFSGLSTIQSQKAAKKNSEATKTITNAGYERRNDDWRFQADSAQKEIAQIEKQIIAAEIRKSIAEHDLATLGAQIANAKEVDDYMHNKYTNVELYSWMVTQVSSVYFQSYQLAYDIAKRAEKCLTFELPLISIPGTGFIKFGYWDSLKKGLMSGEKLQYDLRKMELAYLEANKRELELTKHFSLALNDPEALLTLRDSGTCVINCEKYLFDLDYPGHYNRRVKSVSISIPCVAGPYTTIVARITQSEAKIESAGGAVTDGFTSPETIVTSGAQNDSGVFELNFKDERYLPFEGSGAICKWTLTMMEEKTLRQFDYRTISDIIVHVKYTSEYSDTKFLADRDQLKHIINGESIGSGTILDIPAYFSLKHQFANAWFAYGNAFPGDDTAQMGIVLSADIFPYLAQNKKITIVEWEVLLRPKAAGLTSAHSYELEVQYTAGTTTTVTVSISPTAPYTGSATMSVLILPGSSMTFSLRLIDATSSATNVDMNVWLDDIYLVPKYNLSLP